MMGKTVRQYNTASVIKEMGLKVGYFVGFLHPPEENLPIQKSYTDE